MDTLQKMARWAGGLALVWFLFAQTSAYGQSFEEPGRFVRVVLNDGSIKEGLLVEMNDLEVTLQLDVLGITRIPKYLVDTLRDIDAPKSSRTSAARAYDVNPQASRYFFAPSGMQLRAGEGYFQSNIALNSVSYGLSDHFTAGGIVSFLGGGATVKVGMPVGEKAYISAGGIGFADFYGLLDQPLGLAFANLTLGTEERNVTFNVGFGNKYQDGYVYGDVAIVDTVFDPFWSETWYVPGEQAELTSRPFIANVSAMLPMGVGRWLLTENYWVRPSRTIGEWQATSTVNPPFFYAMPTTEATLRDDPESFGIISLGIRSLNRRTGWLWDYGLVGIFTDGGNGFAAPWFSFTFAF